MTRERPGANLRLVIVGSGILLLAIVAIVALTVSEEACPAGMSHRGNAYSGSPPENSLLAFEAAWKTVGWVEADVRFTSDGVPVVMHDETVDRATDGTGRVHEMTVANFKALRLADGQNPPTLAELLALTGPDRRAVIEISRWIPPAQEKALIAALRGRESWVRVSGFSYVLGNLQRIEAANPLLHTSLVTEAPVLPPPPGTDGQDLQLTPSLTAAQVGDLHRAGREVTIWLPNNEAEFARARDLGADMVLTNSARRWQEWASTVCSD